MAGMLLHRLAVEEERLPALFLSFEDRFRAVVGPVIALFAPVERQELTAGWKQVLDEGDPQRRMTSALAFMSDLSRRLMEGQEQEGLLSVDEQALAGFQAALAHWRVAVEEAVSTDAEQQPATSAPAVVKTDAGKLITPASMTDYLRGAFPQLPDIHAVAVELMTAGSQKWTALIELQGAGDSLPSQVILRQDTGSGVVGENVVEEAPVLDSLARTGLARPALYHVGPRSTALGGPFILMQRMFGRPAGSFVAGFAPGSRPVCEDLARVLARLHSTDPATVGIRPSESTLTPQQWMTRRVEGSWNVWRQSAVEPSPLIESAFAWIRREVGRGMGPPSVVHGDVKPDNFLVGDDRRISALLDWEFAHVGDAGEDLGYCRPFVERQMPWTEFMDIYHDAGAPHVEDRRVRIGTIWGQLRNASWSVQCERECREGRADDFVQRAHGMLTVPFLEAFIARSMLTP